jgi:hypothetical protein
LLNSLDFLLEFAPDVNIFIPGDYHHALVAAGDGQRASAHWVCVDEWCSWWGVSEFLVMEMVVWWSLYLYLGQVCRPQYRPTGLLWTCV